MATDSTATQASPPQTPAASVPAQGTGPGRLSPPELLLRQVKAIDAWIAARRDRERALSAPGLTRDERMDVAREIEALRRTHDAMKGRCAQSLGSCAEPMGWPGTTAVIAHRHEWFAAKLSLLLAGHGVTVLACTDNGAEAVGVIVAEQPSIVVVGDRLAMTPGRTVLSEARRYAPHALLTVQASDPAQADALQAVADKVFPRHHPPAVVADAIAAMHLSATPGTRGSA